MASRKRLFSSEECIIESGVKSLMRIFPWGHRTEKGNSINKSIEIARRYKPKGYDGAALMIVLEDGEHILVTAKSCGKAK